MTEFRGVAYSPQYVPSTAGAAVPIQMPADIVAGDVLVVAGSGYNLVTAIPPAGWTLLTGGVISVKIADGSEAGATINWTSQDTTSFDSFGTSPNPRASVFAAFSYRFPIPPTTGGGSGPNSQFHPITARFVPPTSSTSFTTPQDSASFYGSGFGGNIAQPAEFFFMMTTAQADEAGGTPAVLPDSVTWYGNPLITDRTGLQTMDWSGDPDSYRDPVGISWADAFYMTSPPIVDSGIHIVVAGGAMVFSYMNGFALFFPNTLAYWGINATTPT